MLEALIDGKRDPEMLAALAKGSLRSKIPELVEALTGRFSEHHAFLARMLYRQLNTLYATAEPARSHVAGPAPYPE
jgi:transposase